MYFDGTNHQTLSWIRESRHRLVLFAMVALLTQPSWLIAQNAQATVTAEAEIAWGEVTKASMPLPPPEAWKTKPPSAKEMDDFRHEQRVRAVRWGDAAADFYYRFPENALSQSARMAHLSALQAARAFGEKIPNTRCDDIEKLLAKVNLTENERFNLRWECAILSAVNKLDVSQEAMIGELEQAARSLEKEFPKKTDSQGLLAAAAARRESKKTPGSEFIKGTFLVEAQQGAEKHVAMNEAKQRALNTDFETIDGKKLKLRDFKGKVLLLHFWTTGTAPAGSRFERIRKLSDKYRARGLEIISINFDSTEEMHRQALQQEPVLWTQVFHPPRKSAAPWREYGVEYLPAIWLLDQNGVLRDEHAGTGLAAKVEGMLGKP